MSHLPHGTKNSTAEERSNERSPHGNLEEPVMKEEVEDTPEEDPINPAPSHAIHVEKKDTSPRTV